MRESALTARREASGSEVLVVHRPIPFTLDQTAYAMHAVVDRHLARPGSRPRVGRSRVRDVLRQIAVNGWPPGFAPDPVRVEFWRRWLLEQAVFTDDPR